MYLVLSALTSSPISLVAATRTPSKSLVRRSVDLMADLDVSVKPRPRPVASRHTDYAIPVFKKANECEILCLGFDNIKIGRLEMTICTW